MPWNSGGCASPRPPAGGAHEMCFSPACGTMAPVDGANQRHAVFSKQGQQCFGVRRSARPGIASTRFVHLSSAAVFQLPAGSRPVVQRDHLIFCPLTPPLRVDRVDVQLAPSVVSLTPAPTAPVSPSADQDLRLAGVAPAPPKRALHHIDFRMSCHSR
jgi:hypothetical protein